jgi:aminoglycoside phosphotransferase family enzyme
MLNSAEAVQMDSGAVGMTAFLNVGLAEKVAFLSDPQSYPYQPPLVEAKETHMSWVFLAGELVYKMKKPVIYPFLNFATLEARRANCLEEVRLNARLAEGVYIGVAPLHATEGGELSLQPPGEVVEWLVCMKRLPAGRMLDELITTATVERCDVERAAAKLTSFYAAAEPVEVIADWVHARFAAEHELDAQLLSDSRFDLETGRTRQTLALMRSALAGIEPYLQQRATAKVYVEGHGDLRPEHVCLMPQPVFIDCLEFNRDLRILDPFDEVAYLGLECERLGAVWVGDIFLSAARQNLSSPAPPSLVNFYRAARALLRARLALAHLTEPAPRTPEKWEPRARQYIKIAHASLQAMNSGSAAEP